jgi:hypothetical protein
VLVIWIPRVLVSLFVLLVACAVVPLRLRMVVCVRAVLRLVVPPFLSPVLGFVPVGDWIFVRSFRHQGGSLVLVAAVGPGRSIFVQISRQIIRRFRIARVAAAPLIAHPFGSVVERAGRAIRPSGWSTHDMPPLLKRTLLLPAVHGRESSVEFRRWSPPRRPPF